MFPVPNEPMKRLASVFVAGARAQQAAANCAGLLAVVLIASCGKREASNGTFELTTSGGVTMATRGTAHAAYASEWSNGEFFVSFDLATADPPHPEYDLALYMPKVPRPGAHPVVGSGRVSGDQVHGVFSLESDDATNWLLDSGVVNFVPVQSAHGVAGDFTVHANCARCGPRGTPSHTVLTGRFETHR
jgi:hypothetical protein